MKELPKTATEYILWSMVPYTEPNLKLAFLPHRFFNDLEQISKKKKQTIRNAYYKAQKRGLIEIDSAGAPRLTEKGKHKLKIYKPCKLKQGAKLMVTFDIPEDVRFKRRHLRLLLKELLFTKVQQSVWVTAYDCLDYLKAEIKQHRLEDYVNVYEVSKLKI